MKLNRQNNRGSTVTTFILSLSVLIGMSAMALDVGTASVERAELRGATASAVLAAAQAFNGTAAGATSATALVNTLLTQNGFGGLNPTVTPGVWTSGAGFVAGGGAANYNALTVNISSISGFRFSNAVGMGLNANIGAVQTRRTALPDVCNGIVPTISDDDAAGCDDDDYTVICHNKDEEDKSTLKLSPSDTDHASHLDDDKDETGACDGKDDYEYEEDSDCDGIKNSDESDKDADGKYTDTDGDEIPDYLDPDSDGDGISDADEGDGDVDGDKIPDYKDTDADGDGIDDSEEGKQDLDGDGDGNYKDTDADGDGDSDKDEGKSDDEDKDSVPDYLDPTPFDSCSSAMSRLFQ